MRSNALVRAMAGTIGMRAFLFPMGALCSLTAQGLMIREIGVTAFGAVSLIVTLPQLIPFADLGLSTAITNAYARHAPNKEALVRVAWTLMLMCGGLLVAVCVAVQALVGWGPLLGLDLKQVPIYVLLFFALTLGLNIPLGIGSRILLGMGEVTRSVALSAVQPLLYVAMVYMATVLHRPDLYYVALGFSQLLTSALVLWQATRRAGLPGSTWLRLTTGVRAQRRKLYASAGPMMVITAGLPVALESHRLVLSHLWHEQLGVYSVAMALYTPTWALVGTMGLNLWPYFASRQDHASRSAVYNKVLLAFAGMAVGGGIVFAVLAPVVTRIWSGQSVPTRNWWVLALLLLVQTLHLPAGMLLTEPRELALQAVCVVLMAISTVVAMIWLVPRLGAPGPALASAVSIAIFQLVPCALVASGRWTPRMLRSRAVPRRAVPEDPDDSLPTTIGD